MSVDGRIVGGEVGLSETEVMHRGHRCMWRCCALMNSRWWYHRFASSRAGETWRISSDLSIQMISTHNAYSHRCSIQPVRPGICAAGATLDSLVVAVVAGGNHLCEASRHRPRRLPSSGTGKQGQGGDRQNGERGVTQARGEGPQVD
jgi:hypothetical protein